MLSREENELLTRVGTGTPMGSLLREYWQPMLLSSELPAADGSPLRVRLLGEDLIVFRDTSGQLGLLGDHCPHRGASLFFGRNEECGLRCVYHGWKFDASGACVDMPNEPPESNFKDKIHHTAYPTRERGGVIWAYLGPRQPPPPLPALEWNTVPPEQCHLSVRVAENNWVQAMEGEIDSSHGDYLHGWLRADDHVSGRRLGVNSRGLVYRARDRHPRFETLDTAYGVIVAARRDAEEDSYYWRLTQFLLPFHTIIPPYGEDPMFTGHAWVPIDDELVLALCFTYHPLRPLTIQEVDELRFGRNGMEAVHASQDVFLPPTSQPFGAWRPKFNRSNDYGLDYADQRARRYSGTNGIWPQDSACQESMGTIYDRTQEHLGVSDSGIIRVRRRLIEAARALDEQRTSPGSALDGESFRVRSASAVLPRGQRWLDGAREMLTARPDVNFAAV